MNGLLKCSNDECTSGLDYVINYVMRYTAIRVVAKMTWTPRSEQCFYEIKKDLALVGNGRGGDSVAEVSRRFWGYLGTCKTLTRKAMLTHT